MALLRTGCMTMANYLALLSLSFPIIKVRRVTKDSKMSKSSNKDYFMYKSP